MQSEVRSPVEILLVEAGFNSTSPALSQCESNALKTYLRFTGLFRLRKPSN